MRLFLAGMPDRHLTLTASLLNPRSLYLLSKEKLMFATVRRQLNRTLTSVMLAAASLAAAQSSLPAAQAEDLNCVNGCDVGEKPGQLTLKYDNETKLTVTGVGTLKANTWQYYLRTYPGLTDKEITVTFGGSETGSYISLPEDSSRLFFAFKPYKLNLPDNLDTRKVKDMSGMFSSASDVNPNVRNWDTSNVKYMTSMFAGAKVAQPDTSKWDTRNVVKMNYMFDGASAANPDTSNWNTSKVEDMSYMFRNAISANPDTSRWNTQNVTDMHGMFQNATSANPNTANWDTGKVLWMSNMFEGATSANPDVSKWDVRKVYEMNNMFKGATNADPDVSKWQVNQLLDARSMFYDAINANPDVRNWEIEFTAFDMFCGATKATLWRATILNNMDVDCPNRTPAKTDTKKDSNSPDGTSGSSGSRGAVASTSSELRHNPIGFLFSLVNQLIDLLKALIGLSQVVNTAV